jgi:signal transduction histidine kinase
MDKVVNLLSDLWESSEKPSTEFPDKVNLHQVIEGALSLVRPDLEKKKISVQNEVSPSLPVLKVDQKQFSRLFELLLREEAASLPVGGKVKWSAQAIGPKEGPAEIQIELEDNGPGLPQDAIQSIFDPFFVRNGNPQEFGIYLMTCFFIVYHHGGRISARSHVGQKNIFTLIFPLSPVVRPDSAEEKDFISKILMNETMWEKLLTGQ